MKCEDCRYWWVNPVDDMNGMGECRRYAPRPLVIAAKDTYSNMRHEPWWALTFKKHWCGEFKEREVK